jgi:uridine kinase
MEEKTVTLIELSKKSQEQHAQRILAARVKGEICSLNRVVDGSEQVEFLDINTPEGAKIYQRSLCFVMIKAAHDLFPAAPLIIKHSLGKGIYCEWGLAQELTQNDISQLESRMRMLVEADIPFIEQLMGRMDAIQAFKAQNAQDKVYMLRYCPDDQVNMYSLSGFYNYFNGCLVPSTGFLREFGLTLYPPGFLLNMPAVQGGGPGERIEYNKLSTVLREADNWGKYLGSQYVCELNSHVQNGSINEILWLAEALHEKRVVEIADLIANQRNKLRLILIAGPSSSGKTTFAKRLMTQLRVNGLKPVAISLDDFFVSRELTPLDVKGDYDFESIYALDLPLFNHYIQDLLAGKKVQLPKYNFKHGVRETGNFVQAGLDQPIIIEGIHGLNEHLTASIGREKKFKIYISALTRINLDHHNIISTTDTRVLRRIVRDNQYRGYRAAETIQRWPAVQSGEQRNIFPFQKEADTVFNSALLYEWSVLRTIAEPLLRDIGTESKSYEEAQRLLHLLSFFQPMDMEIIPQNSILREFIGGSYIYGV